MSEKADRRSLVYARCLAQIESVAPDIDVYAFSPDDSLSKELMLDSLMISSLVDALQQEFPGVDMTPWFMTASRDGGDTIRGLVDFLLDAAVSKTERDP